MAAADNWQRFGRWRRGRPFWGGLLLILAAFALFLSANLSLGDLKVHLGMEGYLSYVLPVILLLCGVLAWVSPGQRHFYAIIGLLTSLYSLMGLNLGGFGAGMILGVLGGALVIAWSPDKVVAPGFSALAGGPAAGSSREPPPLTDPAISPEPRDGRGHHRKLLVITLAPLLVSAGVLAAGHAPARADDDCPDGVPSRSASAPSQRRTEQKPAAKKSTPTRKPAAKGTKPAAKPSEKANAAEPEKDGSGNPIVDGWNDFVEGVGDLLGIGGDESPSPSPSDSASPSPAPSSKPKPTVPGLPAPPAPSSSSSPTPSGKTGDVPCLGPRVLGKKAGADDVPQVSIKAGIMTGDSLEMFDSTYDGVTEIDTAEGTKRVLKFSMRESITRPFTLAIPEPGGRTTLIESGELKTTGNVRFYTKRFKGKLFGLIPVTFTPDQPPPLTLPYLKFTDVDIDLDFVRSDVLTGKPLEITEQS